MPKISAFAPSSTTGTQHQPSNMAFAHDVGHNDRHSQGRLSTARTWSYRHPRFVWTVSASVSLLSTRYLLVESNFHYPVLLYLAQLIVATVAVIVQTTRSRKARGEEHVQRRGRQMHRGTYMALGAMCFAALSMLCMLQAVLHFTNLPTLTMLVVSLLVRARLLGY